MVQTCITGWVEILVYVFPLCLRPEIFIIPQYSTLTNFQLNLLLFSALQLNPVMHPYDHPLHQYRSNNPFLHLNHPRVLPPASGSHPNL